MANNRIRPKITILDDNEIQVNSDMKIPISQSNNQSRIHHKQIGMYQKVLERCELIGWKCLSESYINSDTPMTFLCNNGHTHIQIWRLIRRDVLCSTCRELKLLPHKETYTKKKTIERIAHKQDKNRPMTSTEQFYYDNLKIKVASLGWTLVSDKWISADDYMSYCCQRGHIIEKPPCSLIANDKCGECFKEDRENEFRSYVESFGYALVGQFTGIDSTMTFLCPEGHHWITKGSHFKANNRCTHCNRQTKCDSYEDDLRKYALTRGYRLIGRYVNNMTKIGFICPNNHYYECIPYSFRSGHECRKCANRCPIEAGKKLYELAEEKGFVILDKYLNSYHKVRVQCPSKKHIYLITPHYFRYRQICPHCNNGISIGESNVKSYLISKGITPYSEVTIPQLPGRRYDVSFEYNDKKYLLEWDGEQHFQQIEFFTPTYEEFIERQRVDRVKTFTALECGYHVIRIDYTRISSFHEDIEAALDLEDDLYLSNEDMYQYLFEEDNETN